MFISFSTFNQVHAIAYTAIQDGNWSDSATWGQVIPPSSTDFVFIPTDRIVTISAEEIIDNNGGTYNNGMLINKGTLNSIGLESEGTINNEGQLIIGSNGYIENRGGTINNSGTITLEPFTEFVNIFGIMTNSGIINDSSTDLSMMMEQSSIMWEQHSQHLV